MNVSPFRSPRVPVGEAELMAWLVRAAPGDRIAYWRGHLAIDASPLASPLCSEHRIRLAGIGDLAWRMARAGWIHLLQLRHGPNDFSYLAVARPRSHRRSGLLLATLAKEAA